jgi:hypothetical protein
VVHGIQVFLDLGDARIDEGVGRIERQAQLGKPALSFLRLTERPSSAPW